MKKKVIIGIVLLLAVLGIGAISAYLMDADFASNKTTIGGSNITIDEKFDPPAEVHPGDVISKDVKIRNLGPSNCYVRVKAVFTNSDMGKYCTVDWNTTDWVYQQEDGYYYYKKALTKGETTTSLFTTISVDPKADEQEFGDLDVLVYAESYQQGNFKDYVSAWQEFKKNKPQ